MILKKITFLLAFSGNCCSRIDLYRYGRKKRGTFSLQAEKVNRNCYYLNKVRKRGIWTCGGSWWYGELSDKGECYANYHASKQSNPSVQVQDDSLSWKRTSSGNDRDYYDFVCV